MTKYALVLLAVFGVATAASGSAAADKDSVKKVFSYYPGAVKFEQAESETDTAMFSGRVAPRPCKDGRKVTVQGVGSDITDNRGRFSVSVTGRVPNGKYSVSTTKKVLDQGKTTVICRATSRPIRITTNGSSQPRRPAR